jgi:hypothetical protein
MRYRFDRSEKLSTSRRPRARRPRPRPRSWTGLIGIWLWNVRTRVRPVGIRLRLRLVWRRNNRTDGRHALRPAAFRCTGCGARGRLISILKFGERIVRSGLRRPAVVIGASRFHAALGGTLRRTGRRCYISRARWRWRHDVIQKIRRVRSGARRVGCVAAVRHIVHW